MNRLFLSGLGGSVVLGLDALCAWGLSHVLPLDFWQAMILSVGITAHGNRLMDKWSRS